MNRDVALVQETTTDLITGALDVQTTIDNRFFSEKGHESIANDFENLGDNTVYTAQKLWNLPNTAAGWAWGASGVLFGAELSYDEEKDIAVFTNHFDLGVYEGFSLGEVNIFPDGRSQKDEYTSKYTGLDIISGVHEFEHVKQSRKMGPLYAPIYIGSGGLSGKSWVDVKADEVGNAAYKEKYQ